MKFIGKSYSLYYYTKYTHQIWCRSSKFLSKTKSCSRSSSESGSWFYFGFQYQAYILYIEDTHQILFGSANSCESYCVHSKSPCTDRQTDGNFYFLITYGECKKGKYCNRTREKENNSLLLTNVHVLYVLKDQTSKKKFRLSVRLYVDFSCGHNNFRRS